MTGCWRRSAKADGARPDPADRGRAAGAKVEMGTSGHGLLRQSGRVAGVTTSAGGRRARLVIGADGRNSRIARLAGAQAYHDHPPVTFG